jgi:pilus assembly protein CpaD
MKAQIILLASIGGILSGCGTIGATGPNTSLYSSNQPVVTRTNYAIDVNVDSYNGMLPSETQRVSEWFDALKLGFGDRIAVDFGDNGASRAMTDEVSRLASLHGMTMVETAPVTPGNVAPGTARIIVTRSDASVPNCPNWTKHTESNYNSSNHPGYGCAINGNLAAMVADPEDLVRGREASPRNDNGAGRGTGRPKN